MMRRTSLAYSIVVCAIWMSVNACAAHAAEPLIATGAQVTKLADGFVFTEGPAADARGNVYFSDVRSNRTHMWSIDGKLSTVREDTGGGNGLFFDKAGNLFVCEGTNRRIGMISTSGKYSVVADAYDGKKLNRPNDLWVDAKGGIYFSDPPPRGRRGKGPDQPQYELDGGHIYYITPDRRKVIRVTHDIEGPNGLIGTSDGKLLYATDRANGKMFVWKINADGTLADKREFCNRSSDGMTLDERGNLYITNDTVEVYDPAGNLIAKISVPEQPSNVCFGGADRKTLFITARTGLYSLKMNVKGQY